MNPSKTVSLWLSLAAFAACASAPTVEVDRAAAAEPSATSSVAAKAPPNAAGPNNDCWFVEKRDGGLVTVWVSPRMPGPTPGGFRFVNMTHYVANVRGGLLLATRPAPCDSAEPMALAAGKRSLQVRPAAGKTWAAVVVPADLVVEADGRPIVPVMPHERIRSPANEPVAN